MDINKVDPGSGDISEDSTEKPRHISRTESHGKLFLYNYLLPDISLLFTFLLKESSGKLNYTRERNRIDLLLVNVT